MRRPPREIWLLHEASLGGAGADGPGGVGDRMPGETAGVPERVRLRLTLTVPLHPVLGVSNDDVRRRSRKTGVRRRRLVRELDLRGRPLRPLGGGEADAPGVQRP